MEKGIKRKNNQENATIETENIENNKIKKSKSDNEQESTKESLRVLEFFCGIGGMVKF